MKYTKDMNAESKQVLIYKQSKIMVLLNSSWLDYRILSPLISIFQFFLGSPKGVLHAHSYQLIVIACGLFVWLSFRLYHAMYDIIATVLNLKGLTTTICMAGRKGQGCGQWTSLFRGTFSLILRKPYFHSEFHKVSHEISTFSYPLPWPFSCMQVSKSKH